MVRQGGSVPFFSTYSSSEGILRTGEATCADMPYETIENYGLYINSDAIAAMGLTVPDDIASQAQECAE